MILSRKHNERTSLIVVKTDNMKTMNYSHSHSISYGILIILYCSYYFLNK